ncbi:aspartate carbamoyltransferase catalytic subunit [Streptococcus entericus]|uniref:aspartate carbamoyltransferase catalytic subunit n=1 Tax=Streptococcus entericus TaxID=155680 RepID=UPI000378B094|nr:aspartate carbamoyltransferase catalytic subunit [Streptococcus entericus]
MINLIRMSDLTTEQVYGLIHRALALKAGSPPLHRSDLFVSNLFFENSTRTKHSFEVAEQKLGLRVINFDADTSSVNKGESLYDTCQTMAAIGCQVLVIRHPKENYYAEELAGLTVPVINGGDGSGEHPSQCLLDLMTIYERFGRIEGLRVAIVGDIKHSRVARSNYHTLKRLGATVVFVGPEAFEDKTLGEMVDFDTVLPELDVCMLLRLQHERHFGTKLSDITSYHQAYGLTLERYKKLKQEAIVMHPAPVNRGAEIASQLVEADKSVIFEQMTTGVFMRQAILEHIITSNNL